MCLAIPAQVTALLPDDMATVSISGVSRCISLALVDNIKVNDYVIVHVGYALTRLDEKQAKRTLAIFKAARQD